MKLYLDSMLWVYFFERHPQFRLAVHNLLARTQVAKNQLLSSELILAEVLVMPKRTGDIFTAAHYRRFFRSPEIMLISFTGEVTERFSSLRATSKVKPADALHLALASSANVDYFVTNDFKLHALSVPGIARICSPDDVP